MTDAATANRLARKARERNHAARIDRFRRPPKPEAAKKSIQETPRTAAIPRVSVEAPVANDPNSAEDVLADAHAVGLVGLKPRAADSPVVKDMRSAADKKEDAATEAMLEEMRRVGVPGLRKR